MEMLRQFETNRVKANPTCPCGKSNRDGKFATERGFAGQAVGYCHSCSKNFTEGTISDFTDYQEREIVEVNYCKSCTTDVEQTFDANLDSDFAQFLIRTVGEKNAVQIVQEYYLGVLHGHLAHGNTLSKDVIFWQIDNRNVARAGKIISYTSNGKRRTNTFPPVKWWHKELKQDCKVKQCFFGEHLIELTERPIAVVESEKTACLMSYWLPYFIWIACGGKTALSHDKCESIKKYNVVLFPDAGCYDDWQGIAERYGFGISKDCENWLRYGYIKDGDDIADYYLQLIQKDSMLQCVDAEFPQKIDLEWNQQEYELIFGKEESDKSDA